MCRGAAQPGCLAIQLRRIAFEPCEIGLRISRRFDRVLLGEQTRNLEECAGVLRHDVRSIAPRPVQIQERDITVRKREAFERELVRGAHHIEVDSLGIAERRHIDGLELAQPRGDSIGDVFLALRGPVRQLRLQCRSSIAIDPQTGCALRIVGQQLFGKPVQHGLDRLRSSRLCDRWALPKHARRAGARHHELAAIRHVSVLDG